MDGPRIRCENMRDGRKRPVIEMPKHLEHKLVHGVGYLFIQVKTADRGYETPGNY